MIKKSITKKNPLLTISLMTCLVMAFSANTVHAGKATPSQLAKQGERNGCRDGSRDLAGAQSAYYDIMYNNDIPLIYRESYDAGWGACRVVRANGTAVPEPLKGYTACFNTSTCSDFAFGKIVKWALSSNGGNAN